MKPILVTCYWGFKSLTRVNKCTNSQALTSALGGIRTPNNRFEACRDIRFTTRAVRRFDELTAGKLTAQTPTTRTLSHTLYLALSEVEGFHYEGNLSFKQFGFYSIFEE